MRYNKAHYQELVGNPFGTWGTCQKIKPLKNSQQKTSIKKNYFATTQKWMP